jgi:hypothetical protein
MFCADDTRNCREGLFSVRPHEFHGRVSVVTNQYCVSSCDGFVYALKEELGTRLTVLGQPQAADSAYARLTIYALPHLNGGVRFEVGAIPSLDPALQKQALFSQTVVVSRSVKADGTVVSGIPVPIDRFVLNLFHQDERDWRRSAVKAALE